MKQMQKGIFFLMLAAIVGCGKSDTGELVGVQKAQISKIENNTTSARFDTVMKVFSALEANVYFRIEFMPDRA